MLNGDGRSLRAGFVLCAVLVLCAVAGCAHKLSSDLFEGAAAPLPPPLFQRLVLGVDSPRDGSQSYQLEKFIEALRSARLFASVDYSGRVSRPDLILRSFSFYASNPLHACFLGFEGQILTIGTLGLFPQVCKSEHRISFVLSAPKEKRHRKPVTLRYETRSIMGWAALFYLPFEAWSARPAKERYPDVLKVVLTREAESIEKLLQ